MQVNGIVIISEVDVQVTKKDGGNYQGSRLTYRTQDGKIQEQAFHNNTFKFKPALKVVLQNLKAGDNIVIDKEKNSGGFWEVQNITQGGVTVTTPVVTAPKAATASPSPKSTYETPEERAQKQIYIVRQSSLSNAIATLDPAHQTEYSIEDVIKVAKQFETYVFGGEFDDGSFKAMKGDEKDVF